MHKKFVGCNRVFFFCKKIIIIKMHFFVCGSINYENKNKKKYLLRFDFLATGCILISLW